MKKKDMLEFILKVESKALRSVNEKWEKLINEKKEETMSKYNEEMNSLQQRINKITEDVKEFEEKVKDDESMKYSIGRYNKFENIISSNGYLDLKKKVYLNSQFLSSTENLKKMKQEEYNEVNLNYNKVYTICSKMKNGKQINDYLLELGFDTSSYLEKEEKKIEVDKTKLFVCKDNK